MHHNIRVENNRLYLFHFPFLFLLYFMFISYLRLRIRDGIIVMGHLDTNNFYFILFYFEGQ